VLPDVHVIRHIGGFAFWAATILLVAEKRPEVSASSHPVH
jgi:hypothetical protein